MVPGYLIKKVLREGQSECILCQLRLSGHGGTHWPLGHPVQVPDHGELSDQLPGNSSSFGPKCNPYAFILEDDNSFRALGTYHEGAPS